MAPTEFRLRNIILQHTVCAHSKDCSECGVDLFIVEGMIHEFAEEAIRVSCLSPASISLRMPPRCFLPRSG